MNEPTETRELLCRFKARLSVGGGFVEPAPDGGWTWMRNAFSETSCISGQAKTLDAAMNRAAGYLLVPLPFDSTADLNRVLELIPDLTTSERVVAREGLLRFDRETARDNRQPVFMLRPAIYRLAAALRLAGDESPDLAALVETCRAYY